MDQSAIHTPFIIKDEQKKTAEEIIKQLGSSKDGISEEEARKRLEQYGPNELIETKSRGLLDIFIDQFRDVMVIILIAATGLSLFLGEYIDAIVIVVIIVINAVLGTTQEYRAEKAVEALKELAAPVALVIREGRKRRIPSRELVPGDIIEIETGEKIPADARLIFSMNLKVDEAILTGESVAVSKSADIVLDTNQIAEMKNMVFSSTLVTYGRGRAIVTKTGMYSQLGVISTMVQEADEGPTPLEVKLNDLSKALAVSIIFISIGLLFLEFFVASITQQDPNWLEVILLVVSLAVSSIPEGLPAIITATLAIGTQQMARRKAIIRRLSAAQTLGTTTVIVSDKTGTLTKNEMTVRELYTLRHGLIVTGEGYGPDGQFYSKTQQNNEPVDPLNYKDVRRMITTGLMCNTSRLQEEKNGRVVIGDPTEAALLVLAEKAKIRVKTGVFEEITEIPFESARKRMTMIYRNKGNGEIIAFVKGAPEIVLELCSHVLDGEETRKITEEDVKKISAIVTGMAKKALRVLLMASRVIPEDLGEYTVENTETKLTFLGVVGIMDPPRPEVKESIALCEKAGIKVIMNTGDHLFTAIEIAKEIGLYRPGNAVLTGKEIDKLDDDALDKVIDDLTVVARVNPAHKVRILESLKRKGHQV
ncbi:MAG: cation-translocating P-type ATPase, partial [Candidatus Ranarchaeia archaeon]